MSQTNNTLRTGVDLAGRTITIQTLNETFPRDDDQDETRQLSDATTMRWSPSVRNGTSPVPLATTATMQDSVDRAFQLALQEYFGEDHTRQIMREQGRLIPLPQHPYYPQSSLPYYPSTLTTTTTTTTLTSDQQPQDERRLPVYQDGFDLTFTRFAVNLDTCTTQNPEPCLWIFQTTCVILEEGDDPEIVEEALTLGIGSSLDDDTYIDAIPPEHIP